MTDQVSSHEIVSPDGVRLHVQAAGEGPAVVFVHELLGNGATFAPVVQRMRGHWRCITYNARGYPPSDVPAFSPQAYSEATARQDLLAVLDGLGIERAHLVGVSMGAACALNVALAAPRRVASMVLASIGSGSDTPPAQQAAAIEAMAAKFDATDLPSMLQDHASRPNRRSLAVNDPDSFALFQREFLRLDPNGLAATLRGIQKGRPPLYEVALRLRDLQVPALVVLGGDDQPCRRPCEFLADALPHAELRVMAGCGHTPNLERVDAFAALCEEFLARHVGDAA
jgi:pimeloyl-ACP methyl ester carboxylesterase